jgi:L-2-hydroxyglutarate oxidase LhgO
MTFVKQDGLLDVVVVGGGIVGLATAFRLLEARPSLAVAVVEKEDDLGTHQTGHNSGVLHAGVYYAPGSLKARLCREGKLALEQFAGEHDIPVRHCGKLIVALNEAELPRLMALKERATANGVEGLEDIGPERMRELEPHVSGIRALWSPRTGIVDFRRVALTYAEEVMARGGTVITGTRVVAVREMSSEQILLTSAGRLRARVVVICAGLQADRVAARSGVVNAPHVVPFRGDYYTLTPNARALVNGLVYPVPDLRFPFLGVHFTRRIDDEVWAGPNAVLAFAREGYRRRDINMRDLAETLFYPGFWRLARPYIRTGLAEMWRDAWKPAFVAALQHYIPELRGDQLVFGPSGVRAQAVAQTGAMVDDFAIGGSEKVIHVINAPSPAATSSLAIGRVLAEKALERFALGPASVPTNRAVSRG